MRIAQIVVAATMVLAACEDDDGTSGGPDSDDTRDAAIPDAPLPTPDAPPATPDGMPPVPDAEPTSPDAAPPPPDGPPAPVCATPPTGEWTGLSRVREFGTGSYVETRADLTWTSPSTGGCVDRYVPVGTAQWVFALGCCCDLIIEGGTTAIGPGDGGLLIDRTRSPATYTMSGMTRWNAYVGCLEDGPLPLVEVGGQWAAHEGEINGDVLGAFVYDSGGLEIEWQFTRVGATFPPPAPCSEPAADSWSSVLSMTPGATATVTWRRVATTGCLDRFEPSGTAVLPAMTSEGSCVTLVYSPNVGAIEPDDGYLEIDRSTSPPTFHFTGTSDWPGTTTCTDAEGRVSTWDAVLAHWAEDTSGRYDGDRFAAATERALRRWDWRFVKD